MPCVIRYIWFFISSLSSVSFVVISNPNLMYISFLFCIVGFVLIACLIDSLLSLCHISASTFSCVITYSSPIVNGMLLLMALMMNLSVFSVLMVIVNIFLLSVSSITINSQSIGNCMNFLNVI